MTDGGSWVRSSPPLQQSPDVLECGMVGARKEDGYEYSVLHVYTRDLAKLIIPLLLELYLVPSSPNEDPFHGRTEIYVGLKRSGSHM